MEFEGVIGSIDIQDGFSRGVRSAIRDGRWKNGHALLKGAVLKFNIFDDGDVDDNNRHVRNSSSEHY